MNRFTLVFIRVLIRLKRIKALPVFIRRFFLECALRLVPIGGAATSANAQSGQGVELHYWDTAVSPAAYTKIGQVLTFGPLGKDRTEINSSDLDSVVEEFIGGRSSGRSITITAYLNTANIALFESLYDANALVELKATWPAPSAHVRYFGFTVLGLTLGGQVEGTAAQMVELSGRISSYFTTVNPN